MSQCGEWAQRIRSIKNYENLDVRSSRQYPGVMSGEPFSKLCPQRAHLVSVSALTNPHNSRRKMTADCSTEDLESHLLC